MAGLVYLQGFSVGTDVSITIQQDQSGQVIVLEGRLSSEEFQADDTLVKSQPIDNGGLPDHQVFPDGWTGTLQWDRQNDAFSAYYASLEAARYNGGPQITHTITETKRNVGGGPSARTQLLRAIFHKYKPGTWTKTAIVKGSVEVVAQQRVQLNP